MFNYKEILEKAKIILRAIGNRGYLAYLGGESVVNAVLGRDSNTATIITNAPLDEVKMLFVGYEKYDIDDFNIAIYYDDVAFVITGFYKEDKNFQKTASNELEDYLASCNYSINALAMTQTKKIIDCFGGYKDTNKKTLRLIAKKKKLKVYPNITLEGLRLVSDYGFKATLKTVSSIKHSKAIKQISFEKQIDYVINALDSKYYLKALKFLKKTRMYKYMPVFGEEFYSQSARVALDKDVFIVKALVRSKKDNTITNSDFDKCLSFTKEPDYFRKVIELALKEPKGTYKKIDLFNYGKDVALSANMINNLLGWSSKKAKKIEKDYQDLLIKDISEIKYFEEDIIHDFRSLSLSGVTKLLEEIKEGILEGTLLNDYYEIKEFVSKYTSNDEKAQKIERSVKEIGYSNSNNDYSKSNYEREVKNSEDRLYELETNNLILELEREAERFVQNAIRNLDVYQDEKEKVYRELKEAYKKILIKNTQKYERLK